MRASLLYPPPAPATIPYGSLPALTGWLRKHCHQVVQTDMNVEIWDWLLSREGLATNLEMSNCRLSHGVEYLCANPLLPYSGRIRSQTEICEELKQCLRAGRHLMESVEEGLQDKIFFSGLDYDTHTLFYANHYRDEVSNLWT